MSDYDKLAEAEHYFLQASFVLSHVQANIHVYGSNSPLTCPSPANVSVGVQYINRALEHFPNNPNYLNLAALLLAEGAGRKKDAVMLLERANAINPRDITVANNLNAVRSAPSALSTGIWLLVFTATAAFFAHWLVASIF